MHPDEVAQNYNVSRSNVIKQVQQKENVIKWVQQKEKLIDAAKSEYKNHLKIKLAPKYVNLYKAPEKKFEEYKGKGIVSVLPGYGLVQEKYITKNLVMIPQFSNITLMSILLTDITFE